MGFFKTAIQSLSDMAIQESSVPLPSTAPAAIVDEFLAEMNMMPSLTDAEMVIPAQAVPVRENSRLHRYLVEADDLAKYMISNHITSIMEAIDNIANANGITLNGSTMALVIDEAAVLQEAEELGFNIGGSNSNEGNLGTTGLLGKHLDISKFRRFANSKEMIDTVTNKFGIPIVKKNYKVGLAESVETVDIKPKTKDDQVLNEKEPTDNTVDSKSGNDNLNETSLSQYKNALNTNTQNPGSVKFVPPGSEGNKEGTTNIVNNTPQQPNSTTQDTNNNNNNNNNSVHEDSALQYLRDIASGKYDNDL